jgi:hypothetical protein
VLVELEPREAESLAALCDAWSAQLTADAAALDGRELRELAPLLERESGRYVALAAKLRAAERSPITGISNGSLFGYRWIP